MPYAVDNIHVLNRRILPRILTMQAAMKLMYGGCARLLNAPAFVPELD